MKNARSKLLHDQLLLCHEIRSKGFSVHWNCGGEGGSVESLQKRVVYENQVVSVCRRDRVSRNTPRNQARHHSWASSRKGRPHLWRLTTSWLRSMRCLSFSYRKTDTAAAIPFHEGKAMVTEVYATNCLEKGFGELIRWRAEHNLSVWLLHHDNDNDNDNTKKPVDTSLHWRLWDQLG